MYNDILSKDADFYADLLVKIIAIDECKPKQSQMVIVNKLTAGSVKIINCLSSVETKRFVLSTFRASAVISCP